MRLLYCAWKTLKKYQQKKSTKHFENPKKNTKKKTYNEKNYKNLKKPEKKINKTTKNQYKKNILVN